MSWPHTPMVVTSLPYVMATETDGCDVTGVLLSKQGYRVGRLYYPVCLHISDQAGVAITHCLYWEVRLERTDSAVHICHQPVPVNTGASPSKCLKTSFEIHIFIYYRTNPSPPFVFYCVQHHQLKNVHKQKLIYRYCDASITITPQYFAWPQYLQIPESHLQICSKAQGYVGSFALA